MVQVVENIFELKATENEVSVDKSMLVQFGALKYY